MAEEHRKHLFCLREIISSVKEHKRKRHGHHHHHRRRKLWRGHHETESSSSISSDPPPEDPVTAPAEPPSARTEEPSPGLPESKNSPSDHGDDQAAEPDIEESFPGLAEIPRLLKNCLQKHNKSLLGYPSCKKPNCPYIEITLIDCEYRQLITTQSSIPYVALSYVWGANTKVVPLVEGQKLAQRVSRSIEDAMVVTQYLGMRYLWADQYCINQENLAIKQRQIDEMHEVYSHAELTIIAAVGGDAEAGLAPLCSPSEAGTSWCNVDTDSSASMSSADTKAQDERLASALDAIAGSVWNTRGWTYQESYVSRRILAFHARGIYYECSAMAPFYLEQTEVSETLRASDRFWTGRSLANGPTQRAFATGPWIEILSWLAYLVGAYSRRNLTKSEDALNAFGAVLKNFDGLEWSPFADMDEWRDRDERWCIGIVQGLPFHYKPDEEDIMGWDVMNAKLNTSGLCWHHGVEGNSRRQGFPSWSWVGWHGAVSWTLPYGSAEDGEKTVFQLEVAGFRAGVGEERMDLDEARRAKSGPLVLNLASVAIPATAFASKHVEGTDGRHDNDTISMYGCPMPWGADESVTNATETRWTLQRSYLSHANGTRKASRQTLRQGLQEGTFKLMLVHVYQDLDARLRFQAWILQKTSDHKGKSCYERIGGVNHIVLADGTATEEERDTFQSSLSQLVKGGEFEMFDIC